MPKKGTRSTSLVVRNRCKRNKSRSCRRCRSSAQSVRRRPLGLELELELPQRMVWLVEDINRKKRTVQRWREYNERSSNFNSTNSNCSYNSNTNNSSSRCCSRALIRVKSTPRNRKHSLATTSLNSSSNNNKR